MHSASGRVSQPSSSSSSSLRLRLPWPWLVWSSAVLLLLLLSSSCRVAQAQTDVPVIEVDWREYEAHKPLQVPENSIVKFIWNDANKDYTVTEFMTEDGFDKCDFTYSTQLAITSPYYLIPDSEFDMYTADWQPDTFYYFGCSTGKHCRNRDMKIAIYTGELPTTTTTTPTTSTTTDTTSTTTQGTTTTITTTQGTTTTSTTTTTTTPIPDFLIAAQGAGDTCIAVGGCVIETPERCEQAAEQLNLDDDTVNVVSLTGKVPGCFVNAYGDLTFNQKIFANTNEATSSQSVVCLDCGVRTCPSTCFGSSCDVWTEAYAITCTELESDYSCECGGCLCWFDTYEYENKAADITSKCQTPCSRTMLAGDGYCDDDNNMCGCDWDGGDCCSTALPVLTDYCTSCLCLDPDYTDYCEYGCKQPAFAGDNFCDDQNNHCGCDWDSGDCCGNGTQYTFCSDCECLDPDFSSKACNMGCEKNAWFADGICDDGNNNCGCSWDGGDCCGDDNNYNWCKTCACRIPNYYIDNPRKGRCGGACQKPTWQGDGFCDDGNNNCGCDWDSGDCCDKGAHYTYCLECRCADLYYVPNCDSSCRYPDWLGDGYCDEGNNHCGCDWDGGDCCGNNNMNYCDNDWDANHQTDRDACACLDPNYDSTCDGHCLHSEWQADSICDTENNNCGCDWDGGDCCGASNSFEYCAGDDACACLDPNDSSTCNVGCFYHKYQGDGYCDDENNVCGCDWDGGDCCSGILKFCTDCACLDPSAGTCEGGCGTPNWYGDYTCDDENNNCGCGWDGGDCCGTTSAYDYSECTDCQCLQPDGCSGVCSAKTWSNDGFCDDQNNLCGCGWDGGDCCDIENSNFNYCDTCACLDPDDANYGEVGS